MTLKPSIVEHALARTEPIEDTSVDIVGEWLKQSPELTTAGLGLPTSPADGDQDDECLSKYAAHIIVEKALNLSSAQVRRAYEEARREAGLWSEVLGGDCIGHGVCAPTFECIGCSRKILDPSRGYQVERYLQRAKDELTFATREGLSPLVQQLEQLVQACEVDLLGMRRIEAYWRDAERDMCIDIVGP